MTGQEIKKPGPDLDGPPPALAQGKYLPACYFAVAATGAALVSAP